MFAVVTLLENEVACLLDCDAKYRMREKHTLTQKGVMYELPKTTHHPIHRGQSQAIDIKKMIVIIRAL